MSPRKIVTVLAGLLLVSAILHHPILLVPVALGALAGVLWMLAASLLGAARLLRYGGRRARRDWRNQ